MTISVGGEIGEVGHQNSTVEELRAYLDGYRRELDRLAPGAVGISQGQRPDRDVSTAACRCPDGGVAEVKLDFEVLRELGEVAREYGAGRRRPARRLDPARRAVPPLPGGRDGRDPPRDGLPERALRAPGLPGRRSTARSRRGASPTPPTSASPTRPTSSSCTRPARRRSGRSSASSGTSRRRTRSWPPSGARSRSCSRSSASTASREMVAAYVRPVEVHRPLPDALREVVAAG